MTRSLASVVYHDHVPIHRDGHEGQDRSVHGHRLHDHDKMTDEAFKDPSTHVKGVGGGQWHAEDAHYKIAERQISDEEVGGGVLLLARPHEREKEQVSTAGHHDDGRVEEK